MTSPKLQAPAPDPTEGHTPGPWKYHLGRGANPRFHVQTEAGYQIASTPELSAHAQAKEENAMREANAAMIAQAPTLKAENERMKAVLNEALDNLRADDEPLVRQIIADCLATLTK